MAFIRKRGQSYYLVHNVRKRGRVRQLHLACLGHRPRINEDVIEGVRTKHPFVRVDWEGLKEQVSRDIVQPYASNSTYLRELLSSIRNLHMDIADLHLPLLEMTQDRELLPQVVSGLKLLRSTLDVKLSQHRRQKPLTLEH